LKEVVRGSYFFGFRRWSIKIQVRFTGLIAASYGCKETLVEIPEGATLKELLDRLDLPVKLNWTITSVNNTVQDKSTILHDGDAVLIAPVGGGG
jgi:molybdopterin converting factor small subunit